MPSGDGRKPCLEGGVLTDNGNAILDVHDLDCSKALELETIINQITGVVTKGPFLRIVRQTSHYWVVNLAFKPSPAVDLQKFSKVVRP
ncbi:MAG: hypothetical protein CM15mP74_12390 [Halieaceae bacterium]|nr:MAG: hypothetical protein CM15mP74_12390 [Halieaceae bacterium]